MGVTRKGLPFPKSDDFVKDGATAIQALAQATDSALGGALFRATVAGEPVADNTADRLQLTLTVDDSELFSNTDGNLITYTGTRVVALLSAQVVWAASGAGTRRIALIHDGAEVVAEKVNPIGGEVFPHAVSWPVILTSGDKLGLEVKQTSGGPLDVNTAKFRCVVLGVAPE